MPNEQLKPKQTTEEKITAILNKLTIAEAIEAWRDAGDKLHIRIEVNQNQLSNLQNQLPKKEK